MHKSIALETLAATPHVYMMMACFSFQASLDGPASHQPNDHPHGIGSAKVEQIRNTEKP